ncbi:MAG: hypothetical protein KF754_08815 [Planctomycetes bacterium]|nr:hypothetical protein [Planctomycetota bacterium]
MTRLQDRNGEIVPFRRSRVVRAILAAVRSAGSKDEWVADKLADMVVYFLDELHGGRASPPTAEDVDDTIERALLSSPDLAAVSQAFIASRRQRRELRQIEETPAPPAAGPQVERGQALQGWNRALIAAALVRELNLEAARATEIALAVEQRVTELNLPRLTTGLIRELVDIELLARGLASEPGTINVPRYDISQWLFPSGDEDAPAASQQELGRRAGRRVLGEFALNGILPRAARDVHLNALAHFHGLDTPAALDGLRLDALAVSQAGAGFGMLRLYPAAARGPGALFSRLAALVREAAAFTSGTIVLRQLDAALAEDPEPDRIAMQEGLRLLAWQAPNPLRIEVGPPGSLARELVIRALLDAVAGADSALRQRVSIEVAITPGAFVDPARRALVERLCQAACLCGEPAIRLREPGASSPGSLFGDLGSARHGATLARVSLNLVAPALDQPDLASYLAALDPVITACVDGLAARVRFLERVAMRDLPDPVPPEARMLRALAGATREVQLVPVGLATASTMVSGAEGPMRESALRAAQQVLSYLDFRFRQACTGHHLAGQLGADSGDAARRMAGEDMARVARADPDSPCRLKLADDQAYLPGAALPWDNPLAARMGAESALHALISRDATITAGPAEAMPPEELVRLLRLCVAEGSPRPTRLALSVPHRTCRDCGARSIATQESCPACGSTAWALPPGQKSLFG